jgi:uncharacterized membrane protein
MRDDLVLAIAAPAAAHEKHQRNRSADAQNAVIAAPGGAPPSAVQEGMEEHIEAMEDRAAKSFIQRLIDWFGRMHPFAVHFPIALFPVALVALILARRRGETIELIRALIVVAGAGSVIAAGLGWLNGGLTVNDAEAALMLHRWLGTALGLLGGAVGWWAWRRRSSTEGAVMVVVLGVIASLLLVQGFLGASVTHGMEHLTF